MTDAPERIYTWVHRDGDRMTHVWHGEDGGPGDGKAEYLRADHALALVAEAYEACGRVAQGQFRETSMLDPDSPVYGIDMSPDRSDWGRGIQRGRQQASEAIRALTPSDALAAREADRKRVRDEALWEGRGVTVKPLEWLGGGGRHHAGDYVIEDISYGQREVRRLLRASFGTTYVGDYAGEKPLEAAKAAAQADYERRILSALSPAPVNPLEVAELQSRLARLEADNAVATTWGAAVGARQEDIDGIRKRLRDLCGYGLRPHVRYQAERDRCLRIIQAARSGDINTDMRTLIHLISSGRDVVLNEETSTYRLAD